MVIFSKLYVRGDHNRQLDKVRKHRNLQCDRIHPGCNERKRPVQQCGHNGQHRVCPSVAPTPTSPTIDTGQTITLTILPPTTGTGPYTYLWYSGTSSTCSSDTSTGNTLTSNTFSPTLDPTYYCVQETDATGNLESNTATDMVTVNPQPTITISPATNTIDAGQSVSVHQLHIGWNDTLPVVIFSKLYVRGDHNRQLDKVRKHRNLQCDRIRPGCNERKRPIQQCGHHCQFST